MHKRSNDRIIFGKKDPKTEKDTKESILDSGAKPRFPAEEARSPRPVTGRITAGGECGGCPRNKSQTLDDEVSSKRRDWSPGANSPKESS